MVFITLKLTVFKKINEFFSFTVLLFVVQLLPSLIMDWCHIFSGAMQVILFSFSFIWRYFDLVIKFCFLKRTKFLM